MTKMQLAGKKAWETRRANQQMIQEMLSDRIPVLVIDDSIDIEAHNEMMEALDEPRKRGRPRKHVVNGPTAPATHMNKLSVRRGLHDKRNYVKELAVEVLDIPKGAKFIDVVFEKRLIRFR